MDAPCRQSQELQLAGTGQDLGSQHLLRELRSRQASAYNLDRRKPSPIWPAAKSSSLTCKSKGLEHTFCHTSHVILVTSGLGLWFLNCEMGILVLHNVALWFNDTIHTKAPCRAGTQLLHWSLPLSLTTASEGVTFTFPLCSQPQ